MNVNSGKIMKPNYRPNGYEYFCLAAENSKYGQKKYSTSRMVMKTFDPRENADELEVNHINGDKTQNYYQKLMDDGTIQSNLEWSTPEENIQHSRDTGLNEGAVLNHLMAKEIRKLRNQGYSYSKIQEEYCPDISITAIQMICKNLTYHDPNYKPIEFGSVYNNIDHNKFKLSDTDANVIRKLAKEGYKYKEMKEKFYPHISICTISDVVRGVTHNSKR